MAVVKPVIEVDGLGYAYPDGTWALRGLSLAVAAGSRLALLGPNGAGKSTLLLHLNGILLPASGRVRVLGTGVDKDTCLEIRRRVGLVFQDPDDQVFAPTVWEDVAFGPTNLGLPVDEVARRVEAALEAVGAVDLARRAPHRLSVGQKKRVAIAGVLAMRPDVILLDEPTASLDHAGSRAVLAILDRLNRQGTTLVMATHDVDLAAEWADTVAVMAGGRLVARGGPALLRDEALLARAGLRPPRVAEVFRRARGWRPRPCPMTVGQAVEALEALLAPGTAAGWNAGGKASE